MRASGQVARAVEKAAGVPVMTVVQQGLGGVERHLRSKPGRRRSGTGKCVAASSGRPVRERISARQVSKRVPAGVRSQRAGLLQPAQGLGRISALGGHADERCEDGGQVKPGEFLRLAAGQLGGEPAGQQILAEPGRQT